MEENYSLKDTKQTKRLKDICLSSTAYSCKGEIYQLLNYKTLHDLVDNIKEGELKLHSKLMYGKDKINSEEKFLENLDHYISYVKDHYFIQHIELGLIIELTLKNKYNAILFDMDDYYSDNNYVKYICEFKKMFLFNFYDNMCFYAMLVDNDSYIKTLKERLYKYDFDDEDDIDEIEKVLIPIINNRKDNLYNSFIPHNEYEEIHYDFYAHQIEWVISDYYEHGLFDFKLCDKDHHITTDNGDKILFNISKKKFYEKEIEIKFGIMNNHFRAFKTVYFRKNEFKELYDRLKKMDTSKNYDVNYDFVDSSLRFNFWCDDGYQFLDIRFEYDYKSGNYITILLSPNDTKELFNLIKSQN